MAAEKHTRRASPRGGFTLVELMVSTAIMLIVLLVLMQVIAGMTNIWHNSAGTVSNYQNARAAFTQLTRTLSRATVKTYIDYADANGNQVAINGPIGSVSSASFTGASSYARASELQFICGPSKSLASGLNIANYPGDAVLFQTPSGVVSTSADAILSKSLNLVGYYVEYSDLASGNSVPAAAMPTWLPPAMGSTAVAPSQFRYRLIQYVQPADALGIYGNTTPNNSTSYSTALISSYASSLRPSSLTSNVGSVIKAGATVTGAQNILAENVPLLILRPRLEPQDEVVAAKIISGGYNAANANAVISPNYVYDSRAWMPSFAASTVGSIVTPAVRAGYMRNQLPPIVDVAMVAIDANSIVHLGSSSTAPTAITAAATGLFTNSANMDADLDTYAASLAANKIRFRVFRASVQLEGSGWINSSR